MSNGITDRVWIVTGASSGLGRALADAVLDHGGQLAATARNLESLQEFEQRSHPDHVLAVQLDVTDDTAVQRGIAKTIEKFGRVDVVVNNAGFGLFGALEELGDQQLRREFDTNVFGAIRVMRAALPQMRAQQSGHIVQISSLEGVAPALAGECAYAGTKFAIEGVCEALANEVAHLGINVTIVEPGPLRTDFAGGAVVEPPRTADYRESVGGALEWFEDLAGNQPNDPRRVAQAIIEAVDSPQPPLRLALGVEAIEAIRAKLAKQRAELDTWETLGTSTAITA